MCCGSDGEFRAYHAACRVNSGGCVAFAGIASVVEGHCHKVGVGRLSQSQLRAVFLDRDGTLNRAFVQDGVSRPPTTEAQLRVLPGVPESLAELKRAGFVLVVVTNQPDVARGTLLQDTAERINAALREQLPLIDDVLCCYHDDADRCPCRKPQPGMLLAAAARFGIDMAHSFMLGDSWRDTDAGRRAGCTTIQLRTESPLQRSIAPDHWAEDVSDASRIVLKAVRTGGTKR
jgi:D-glycero-D-manno-heptose 1,7-bisphosphate phosphatase